MCHELTEVTVRSCSPLARTRKYVLLLLVLLLPLSACAAGRTDLVDAGAAEVEVVPTPRSSIRYVTVVSDADETIVSGVVKRLGVYNNAFSGARVCAKALYPDGTTESKADQLLRRRPRSRNFWAIYPDARFRIVFPERLPEGTMVYLKFTAPGLAKNASAPEVPC